MAVGKNKKLGKKRKTAGRKVIDPFSRKEWFDVKAPNSFQIRQIGKTCATKTQGTKIARDSLIDRVFEISLGDLKKSGEDEAYRKFKLKVEDVQGSQCLTNFYGMSLTSDKLRSLVRKWHTLIECHSDVKTSDGYLLRIFVIGFTKRRPNQISKTTYAQTSQVRQIRKKMREIVQKESATCTLSELVSKLIPETIGREIEKSTEGIYPLQNVLVRKVKMLRAPKTDLNKLMELHSDEKKTTTTTKPSQDTGKTVETKK